MIPGARKTFLAGDLKSSGRWGISLKLRPREADKSHIHDAMDEHGRDNRYLWSGPTGRRFTLPSGRVVEVTSSAQQLHERRLPGTLHVCRRCRSKLIQPVEWHHAGGDNWEVMLHCPNCGWWNHGTLDGDQLAELEDHLDSGFDELVRDLKRLRSANLTEEIERFATALELELILPEDF
jgi:hypothetical protein